MVERDDLQRSLSLARVGLRAPSAVKARVRSKLGASLTPASDTTADAATAPARRGRGFEWGRRLGASRPPLGTVSLLMGMSFGAGYWLASSPGSDGAVADAAPVSTALVASAPIASAPIASAPAASGAPSTAAEPAATLPVAPESGVRSGDALAARARLRTPHVVRSASAHDDDRLAAEVALLSRVERAIRAREAPLALALLEELDRKFPGSALQEERAAARVLAHCVANGEGADAREAHAVAKRFVQGAPSVYADRIRQVCSLATEMTKAPERVEEPGAAGH
jgi:hypothetical protein